MTQTMHGDVGGSQSNRISVVFVRTDAEHKKCAYSQGVLCYVADVQKMCVHDGVTKGGILCVDASGAVPVDKFLQSVGNYNPATNVVNFYLSDGTTVMWDMSPVIADILASIPNLHVPATMSSPGSTINVTVSGTDNQTFAVDVDPLDTAVAIVANGFALQTLKAAIDTDDQTATEVPVAPAVRGQSNVQAALEAINNAIPVNLAPSGPAGNGLTGNYPNPGLNAAAVQAAVPYATDTSPGKVTLSVLANHPQPFNDTEAVTPAYLKAAIDAAVAALPGDKFLQGLQSYNTSTNTLTLLLNDGSTVPVDLTGLLNDAVATVPNKHVAATLSCPDGSITTTFGGTDGQTFTARTSAPQIPITDGPGVFVSTNIEDALQELYNLIVAAGGIQNATQTPIQDAGNNYIGTNVEAALAEIASRITTAAALQNAAQTTIADAADHYVGNNVEAALAEIPAKIALAAALQTAQQTTIADTGGNYAAGDVEGALAEIQTKINVAAALQNAAQTTIADAGNLITATTVEGALQELAQVKHVPATLASSDATLTVTATGTNNQTFNATVAPAATAAALVGNATALQTLKTAIDTTATSLPASSITLADTGGNYTATNVEAALAEVVAKLADEQDAISWQLQSGSPTAPGSITTVDITGAGVSGSTTSNKLTLTIPGVAVTSATSRKQATTQALTPNTLNVITLGGTVVNSGNSFGTWDTTKFTISSAGVYEITASGVVTLWGDGNSNGGAQLFARVNTTNAMIGSIYTGDPIAAAIGVAVNLAGFSSTIMALAVGDTIALAVQPSIVYPSLLPSYPVAGDPYPLELIIKKLS